MLIRRNNKKYFHGDWVQFLKRYFYPPRWPLLPCTHTNMANMTFRFFAPSKSLYIMFWRPKQLKQVTKFTIWTARTCNRKSRYRAPDVYAHEIEWSLPFVQSGKVIVAFSPWSLWELSHTLTPYDFWQTKYTLQCFLEVLRIPWHSVTSICKVACTGQVWSLSFHRSMRIQKHCRSIPT